MPPYIKRSAIWPDPKVKPPFGAAQLDTGHPLGASAAALMVMNESGGASVAWPGPSPGAGTLQSGVAWAATAKGIGLTFDGSQTSYVDLGTLTAAALNGSFTLMMSCAVPDTSVKQMFSGKKDTNHSRLLVYSLYASGQISNADENFAVIQQGGSLTDNVSFVVAWTYDQAATSHNLYKDGVLIAGPTSYSLPSYSGQSGIGNASGNPITPVNPGLNGPMEYAYIFGRALTQAELLWVQSEPYAMFRPIVRRRYFVPAAAAAGYEIFHNPIFRPRLRAY